MKTAADLCRSGLLLLAGVILASCGEARKPNIVFILADDLGYGDVGAYGQTLIETPHIDRLATEGVRFTQHYSGSPVCAPSRCVLLTGLHTGHAYIRGNDEMPARGDVWNYAKAAEDPGLEGQRPLPANTVTLGRLLQGAGYKTAVIGKWGLGGPTTEGIPNLQGFDFFFGFNCQRQAHTYYPRHLWLNREKVRLDNELVVPGTPLDPGADPMDPASYARYNQKDYAPELMLQRALSFIDENKENPFFLFYTTTIPHAAMQAPKKWVDKYVAKFGDEAPYLGNQGYFPQRYPHAAYAGMISCLDDQVGQIVERIRNLGLEGDTLILFSSDNGPTYNGGTDSPYFKSAGPFKCEQGWGKGSVHEGGIRVPLIAKWPGRIAPNGRSDHVSVFYDLLPTLCEVAGLKAPQGLDGISFLPALTGSGIQSSHDYLYWEFPESGGQQAVRMGQWKGTRFDILKGNLDLQVYDLETDPLEQKNLAAERPEIVGRILEIMKKEHVPSEVERFRLPPLGD